MVITHFILHLKQAMPSGTEGEGIESLQISTIRFANSVIGNLGEPLRNVFTEVLQPIEDETPCPVFPDHTSPSITLDSDVEGTLERCVLAADHPGATVSKQPVATHTIATS